MLAVREKMILPNWVGVFGEFHKKILTANGFWNDNEIVVIGSKRVDLNRSRYKNVDTPDISMTLLLPTQWTVFEEMKTVVKALIPNLKDGARIILKMHPLENPVHIAGYEDLVKSSGGKLEIAEKEADIFQLINECRLMIGFDSTVLLESITFGKPAVTIGLPTAPMGIHSLFSETTLESSIMVVPIDNLSYLNELIERAFNDHQFYRNWKENAYMSGNELYARNYQSNCRQFIETAFANELFEVNNN